MTAVMPGWRLAGAVATGEDAAAEWGPGQRAQAVPLADWEDLGFDGAGQQRVLGLQGDEAGAGGSLRGPLGFDDLGGGAGIDLKSGMRRQHEPDAR